jgi:membrane associated rhomboid family serine protease
MACIRCKEDAALDKHGFCPGCANEYDGWIRQYASDIVPPAIAAMVIVLCIGMVIPFLGISSLVALAGVFAGFGTMVGMFRLNRRRRRRQFLSTSGLPRAYLPTKT